MKKLMLLVNPVAGKGSAKSVLMGIISCFNDAGYETTVYVSSPERSIQYLANEFGWHYDRVVCIGGDGTLSETVNGLLKDGNPAPVLGYIPAGSTNDFASTLGLPKNPLETAALIAKNEPVLVDLGYYNGNYFTYVAAFGAFANVSYATPQKTKNTFGHLAYIFEGLANLPSIKPVHTTIEYDGSTLSGDFIFGCVANSTSVAGLVKIDPNLVLLNDGLFEVILVRNPMNIIDFTNVISSIISQSYDNGNVVLLHAKKIKFIFDTAVDWSRDGEFGGTYSTITIENKHEAIQIVR